jgi:hypothetical protein
MSAPLTQEQAAELAGLTVRHLRRLDRESNPPPRESSGGYPAAEYGAWLKSRALSGVSVGDDGTVYNYEAERARLTHEQANKAGLEVAELRGELVRSSEVGPYWADMVSSMRAKLVGTPPKIAALIADPIARAKVQAQSEAFVYEALAEIEKDGLPDAARERYVRSLGALRGQSGEAAAEADVEPVG